MKRASQQSSEAELAKRAATVRCDDTNQYKNEHVELNNEHGPNNDANGPEFGFYDSTLNEWVWSIDNCLKLRVGKYRGKIFIDIRNSWQGKPTKKGVYLSEETFRRIQNWDRLNEALKKIC